MRYRKFKADHLFDGKDILNDNNVLITNEKGIIENVIDAKDAGEDIEIFKGLLCPGFVNCHCHLELSHMKDVIETGAGLVDFLIKVVGKRSAVREQIVTAIKDADEEMHTNGIVAVGDICNTSNSLETKHTSNIRYHNFIEVLGFTEERAKIIFENYVNVYKEFVDAGFGENTSIVPHAPYTISTAMFRLINHSSAGKTISIHNQESLAEDELYQTKTGDFLKLYHHLNINIDFFQPYNKTSLRSYLPLLDKAKRLLLVHNTFTTQNDIDFSFEQTRQTNQQVYWCLCPNANLYIENKLPPVELFMQNDCAIVLGSDSYSSNHTLNILDEIKTLQKNFPELQIQDMFKWATLNGAKALGFDETFGSFEKGKQPAILLIDNIIGEKISARSGVTRIL